MEQSRGEITTRPYSVLNTVWVTGTMPFRVLSNLVKLADQYQTAKTKEVKDAFVPVVWMDEQAIKNLQFCVTDPKPTLVDTCAAVDKNMFGPYKDRCKFLKITAGSKESFIPVFKYEDFKDDFRALLADDKAYDRIEAVINYERDPSKGIIPIAADMIRILAGMTFLSAKFQSIGYVDITDTPFTELPRASLIKYCKPRAQGMPPCFVCHAQDGQPILLENDIFFANRFDVLHGLMMAYAKGLPEPDKVHNVHVTAKAYASGEWPEEDEDLVKPTLLAAISNMESAYKKRCTELNAQVVSDPELRVKLRQEKNKGTLGEFYLEFFGKELNNFRFAANEMIFNRLGFEQHNAFLRAHSTLEDIAQAWKATASGAFVTSDEAQKNAYSWKSPGIALLEALDLLTSIPRNDPFYPAANKAYKELVKNPDALLENDPDFRAKQAKQVAFFSPAATQETKSAAAQAMDPRLALIFAAAVAIKNLENTSLLAIITAIDMVVAGKLAEINSPKSQRRQQ